MEDGKIEGRHRNEWLNEALLVGERLAGQVRVRWGATGELFFCLIFGVIKTTANAWSGKKQRCRDENWREIVAGNSPF
jgi:hypothetical protein